MTSLTIWLAARAAAGLAAATLISLRLHQHRIVGSAVLIVIVVGYTLARSLVAIA